MDGGHYPRQAGSLPHAARALAARCAERSAQGRRAAGIAPARWRTGAPTPRAAARAAAIEGVTWMVLVRSTCGAARGNRENREVGEPAPRSENRTGCHPCARRTRRSSAAGPFEPPATPSTGSAGVRSPRSRLHLRERIQICCRTPRRTAIRSSQRVSLRRRRLAHPAGPPNRFDDRRGPGLQPQARNPVRGVSTDASQCCRSSRARAGLSPRYESE